MEARRDGSPPPAGAWGPQRRTLKRGGCRCGIDRHAAGRAGRYTPMVTVAASPVAGPSCVRVARTYRLPAYLVPGGPPCAAPASYVEAVPRRPGSLCPGRWEDSRMGGKKKSREKVGGYWRRRAHGMRRRRPGVEALREEYGMYGQGYAYKPQPAGEPERWEVVEYSTVARYEGICTECREIARIGAAIFLGKKDGRWKVRHRDCEAAQESGVEAVRTRKRDDGARGYPLSGD